MTNSDGSADGGASEKKGLMELHNKTNMHMLRENVCVGNKEISTISHMCSRYSHLAKREIETHTHMLIHEIADQSTDERITT